MDKPVPLWQLHNDLHDCLRDRSAMDGLRDMVARRACIRDTHRLDDAEVIKLARCWLREKDPFVSKREHPEGLHAENAGAKTEGAAPKAELPEGEKAYELESGVILSSIIESRVRRIAD